MQLPIIFFLFILIVLSSAAAITPAADTTTTITLRDDDRDKCHQICTGNNDCSGECSECYNFTCCETGFIQTALESFLRFFLVLMFDLLDWIYGIPEDRPDDFDWEEDIDDWTLP
ncbi:hypothetical protein EYZ11_006887 [Aspergillus tanneri]|uniref:Uncharacterized protein n=1 Tax=Aspergillus tanneri TaxID=1220188 RepID=A0A4S3JGM2_9EURO|nr:hypothetical protein EYZ11_006887 [Aspergillus tanneri]